MNSLIDIETKFQNFLLDSSQDIFHHVISTNKVPVEVRLKIYGNAYRSRLHEALATSYPVLESYLGYEKFEELCYFYIDSHPSCYRSIRWFGDQLAEFLNSHSQYKTHPWLGELAKLEWTMALVFDAEDSTVLKIEEMGSIAPESWINMQLQVHPSTQRLTFCWNAVQIWQAITDEQAPPEPQKMAPPIPWILWRKELMSQFASLSEDEAWAIDAVMNGLTFGEICEGLCQWVDEEKAGMRAASLLKGWITAGLISAIKV